MTGPSRFQVGVTHQPATLIQGYGNESQLAPWFTAGGVSTPKIVSVAVPRGPLVVEIDTTLSGGTASLYLAEFASIEDLATPVGHYIQLPGVTNPEDIPPFGTLVFTVPANTKASQVLTPRADHLAVVLVHDGNAVATIFPSSLIAHGPSSIILAPTGPDISF